jgi:hypothetical protein
LPQVGASCRHVSPFLQLASVRHGPPVTGGGPSHELMQAWRHSLFPVALLALQETPSLNRQTPLLLQRLSTSQDWLQQTLPDSAAPQIPLPHWRASVQALPGSTKGLQDPESQ